MERLGLWVGREVAECEVAAERRVVGSGWMSEVLLSVM